METTEKTQEFWIKKILQAIKTNKILSTLAVAAILGIGGFAWRNADPPLVKAQIEDIKSTITNHIKDEDKKDAARDIDVEVLKTRSANTDGKVDDIKEELKKNTELILQVLINTKQIKSNTTDK